MYLHLERTQDGGIQTIGTISLISQSGISLLKLRTLELPFLNNQRQISCIPAAVYICKKTVSARFGKTLHVQNVDGRSGILFHAGNYKSNTKGCILLGLDVKDINGDGVLDISSSAAAMAMFLKNIPQEIPLLITNKF